MRRSVLFIGVLVAATTCVTTGAFGQSGEVTNGAITDCDLPYDVGWSGTWDAGGHEVIGVCERDYVFGSVPVVIDEVDPPGSSGVASVHVAKTYYMYGYNWPLVGAYVWFEFGEWYGDVWYCYGATSWYHIDYVPTCFAGGTPVLTLDGSKPIEQLTAADRILSSPGNDPDARPVASRVKEVIRSRAQVVDVTVAGHTVRASHEHPFYVKGKAWTPASSLAAGDLLRSRDGRWLPVESIVDGGECPVYNLRGERNSTYFVGGRDWGFALWVYGACSKAQTPPEGFVQPHTNRHGPREISGPYAWQRRKLP